MIEPKPLDDTDLDMIEAKADTQQWSGDVECADMLVRLVAEVRRLHGENAVLWADLAKALVYIEDPGKYWNQDEWSVEEVRARHGL